jgi:hypothetical protein
LQVTAAIEKSERLVATLLILEVLDELEGVSMVFVGVDENVGHREGSFLCLQAEGQNFFAKVLDPVELFLGEEASVNQEFLDNIISVTQLFRED